MKDGRRFPKKSIAYAVYLQKIVDSKMMRPPQYPECMSDGKGTPIDKSQFQIFAARKCYAKDDSEYKIEHHRLFLKVRINQAKVTVKDENNI